MPKYILCRGCPASGKTEWAKWFIDQQPFSFTSGWVRSNRDDIRRELYNFKLWKDYKFISKREKQVTNEIRRRLKTYRSLCNNVIDDNTNLTRFEDSIEFAESLGYEVEIKDFFDNDLHVLIKRDAEREFSVGEDIIHKMFRNQILLQGREIVQDSNKHNCIIVDVDGTVADMGKGESWGRNPFDWKNVDKDKPKQNVIQIVQLLMQAGEQIIFLSGRDGVARKKTWYWLKDHVTLTKDPILYTRQESDIRSDCVVKEEILKRYVLPLYNVKYAIDDRKQMVDHWRALGLECWQVDAGRF